jgi:tRNA(Arg) A34 adenosine deaminase TadA
VQHPCNQTEKEVATTRHRAPPFRKKMYEVQSVSFDAPLVVEEWLSVIVAPKLCSKFLLLDALAPLPKHVKRVKKKDNVCAVLVAPLACREAALQVRGETGFPDQEPQKEEIPLTRPVRKEQLAAYNAMWPCQFYEVIPDTAMLTADLQVEFEKFMRLALAESKESGCVIVNWSTKQVVACASGSACSFNDHSVIAAIRQNAVRLQENPSSQLFCTGCFVFLVHEPCIMCSMALLHARVAGVVFGSRCMKMGGLAGPTLRIGSHPPLNHAFHVYGGCLESECVPCCK